MISEQRPDRKLLLEDLLRLKRLERPSTDFWNEFERELRTRQLAAAVERPRWWDGMSRTLAGGLLRFQIPVGLAAVLGVTFLMWRDYSEPTAFEPMSVAETSPLPTVNSDAEAEQAAPVHAWPRERESATPRLAAVLEPSPPRRDVGETVSAPRPAEWSLRGPMETPENAASPSAQFIAANLAAVEPELSRLLGGGGTLTAPEPSRREPLAQLSSPRDVRRERLFAYQSDYASSGFEREEAGVGQRIASRISETQLYESVRRLSGGGDRLTVKF